MTKYSAAIDIGASSGRLILGYLEDGLMKLDEIHRFENRIVKKGDFFCWEVDKLFQEIITGLKKCKELGIKLDSIGIDTWAVDFVLLDEADQLITEAVSYRDPRTNGMMEEVFKLIPKDELYLRTGIQFQKFNTIYQLYSIKKEQPEILEKAKSFLTIPDYFNFLLTGKKANEYTNATSTQLVNAISKTWDLDILDVIGMNKDIFQEIPPPKTILGSLKEEWVSELGADITVVLPATHDTGSAVIAVPEENETIYISSGTWSLIGTETDSPICTNKARDYNFTNEGGINDQYRFLKNIMGLWMIQEVKRVYNDQYSFADLIDLAREVKDFKAIVNVNDDRFLRPDNMVQEIINYCLETGQSVPSSPGEIAKCVFESLAESYLEAVIEIEEILEKRFEKINVIGGGCQNEILNQLIADVSNKEVYAGPVEATAIGNIAAQLMALGIIKDIKEARAIIKASFEVKQYKPSVMNYIKEGD
ncbi:rhamnulokinase [Paenibacillus sp. GCM10028914]|uniref:rhamnulokinase n=1 Tax=Paenibacillus sp. GCM10028914 TaxID=3273416 RepID=UPI003610C325